MTPHSTTDRGDMESRIEEQAAWLADRTAMSERQAETFVRDTLRGDAPQAQIAGMMGISESTVSNHLSAANDATREPTVAVPFWLFFGPGPLDPAAYRMTPVWTGGEEDWLVVFENQFPTYTNRAAPRFYVVHQSASRNNDDIPEHVADDISDVRIRHITDRYEFQTFDAMRRALPEALEFDSEQKRDQCMEFFDAYCEEKTSPDG